jgi:PAS domain S-box-containing protein
MHSIFPEEHDVQGTDLEAIPFACCRLQADGAIFDINASAGALLIDIAALQACIHADDIASLLASLASAGLAFQADCRMHMPQGAYRWFMLDARRGHANDAWLCCFIDIDERKSHEERLRRELEIRNGMLDASADCIKVITSDGLLTHMNRAGCDALGVLADSAFGMTWVNLLPESVRESGRAAVALARAGEVARFPGSSQLPGETPRYWDNLLTPLQRRGDDVTAILCMSRDVTLQREAEIRLELAIRATDDAIRDWDLHRDRMTWNEAIQRCYGYAARDIGDTPAWWFERVHADDLARVRAAFDIVIAGRACKYVVEYRFRRADGRYADVHERGYLSRDEGGRAVRIVGTMLDQTDRKAIERNLQSLNHTLEARANERTQELQRLWNTSPDMLLVLGADGVIGRANPAVKDALGYEASNVIGHHIGEYVFEDDAHALTRALLAPRNDASPTVEIRHRHRDGSCRWIAWATASSGADIFATGRDVTARKDIEASLRQTEEALRQAQKMEAIGRLTGNVAHDFNNLLHVIQTSAELLRRPELDAHKRARCIEAISSTADRGARLTRQLLAFGRRSSLTPTRFDVAANIEALREMIGTLVGSRITMDVTQTQRCFVYADSNQFDTAIVNMAVNARDAMSREGRLMIGIRPVTRIPGRAGAGRFIAVSIEDEGMGIPEDQIGSIFEPFYTTKAPGQGTGLGLSQVFGFVKQSGGDVTVESRFGEGSTFTIYLPEAPDDSA